MSPQVVVRALEPELVLGLVPGATEPVQVAQVEQAVPEIPGVGLILAKSCHLRVSSALCLIPSFLFLNLSLHCGASSPLTPGA